MSGIAAAALLLVGCLLYPVGLFAQAAPDASDAAAESAGDAGSIEQRLEALEEALASQRRLEERIQELEAEAAERERAAAAERKRIDELEAAKATNEDAIREIISGTLSQAGSRINEFVDLGGVIEMAVGREQDFAGSEQASIALNTFELQFEVNVTDWARASAVVHHDAAEDLVFTTTEDDEFSIDRINIDTLAFTLGDTQRFPPYLSVGRLVLPFGISTGDPVTDVLNIADPLTVEIFETRKDAILIGFEFPTPALTPELLIAAPPPVRPLVITPLVGKLSRLLGYQPLPPLPPPTEFIAQPAASPPLQLGVFFYNGDTFTRNDGGGGFDIGEHWGAMVAYRMKGDCESTLGNDASAQLHWLHVLCPWTLDLGVEFNRSVFESNFLSRQYRRFLGPLPRDQVRAGLGSIGHVPGMAASVRASLGPVALVAEWNGALESATFLDDTQVPIDMRPEAWQISLAYQFDWKPWVEAIGAQGTYVTLSYSESRDLGGVQRFNPNDVTLSRVGAAPARRFAVGAGEWVLPNVRLAIEYVRAWDYSRGRGGTGRDADAILSLLTFEW